MRGFKQFMQAVIREGWFMQRGSCGFSSLLGGICRGVVVVMWGGLCGFFAGLPFMRIMQLVMHRYGN